MTALARRFPLLAEAEIRAVCGDVVADGDEDLEACARQLQRRAWRLEQQLPCNATVGQGPCGSDGLQYAPPYRQQELQRGASPAALLCDPEYLALRAVDETNAFRSSQHVPYLRWSQALAEIALEHAQNMASGVASFSHEGFSGRVHRYPFRTLAAAENITYNNSTVDAAGEAVQGWKNSPEHRESLQDATFDLCGVGVARAPSGMFFFSQLFACPADTNDPWDGQGQSSIEVRYPETYLTAYTEAKPLTHRSVSRSSGHGLVA